MLVDVFEVVLLLFEKLNMWEFIVKVVCISSVMVIVIEKI